VNTSNTNINDLGVVYKKMMGSYTVYSGERTIQCSLSARLRAGEPDSARLGKPFKQVSHADPLAVGDLVRFTDSRDGTGQIAEVLPRRNRLARRSAVPMPGAHAFEQVIAANVDQVVPVFAAANPAPHWNMLDRYLVSAEAYELPVLICITKLDLVHAAGEADSSAGNDLHESIEQYRQAGYPVILTSALTGEGIDELKMALRGRLSVLVGKSGVGKTFLLNNLQPGLGLRVNAVNQVTGKGRHTTTSQEMFRLDMGGAVVDTPGEREFGLWDVSQDELALLFPEMRPLVGRCRFGLDCQHDEEPGCAIRKAVMAGKISPRRYQSYMRLRQELGAP
jgi:ribosome biogenesis GTPase / thiamine phosphate phosphatase